MNKAFQKYSYKMPWLSDYSEALLDLGNNPQHTLHQGAYRLRSTTNHGQIQELTTRRNNILNSIEKGK